MQWIDKEKLRKELLAGTFLNLGCSNAVEIASNVGFDWLLIDLEHGSGSICIDSSPESSPHTENV